MKEKKINKGELLAQHSGPVSVLKWKDKNDVTVISTYHGEETRMKRTKCRQEKQKSVSVLDYNGNMGGVDLLKDQVLQHYLLERKKMTKWYIKLFRRLLNATVLNCMVICRVNSRQNKTGYFKFGVKLVQAQLINMEVKVSGNFKDHHSTKKMCRDILKDIFQKEYHRQKKRPGQQRGV